MAAWQWSSNLGNPCLSLSRKVLHEKAKVPVLVFSLEWLVDEYSIPTNLTRNEGWDEPPLRLHIWESLTRLLISAHYENGSGGFEVGHCSAPLKCIWSYNSVRCIQWEFGVFKLIFLTRLFNQLLPNGCTCFLFGIFCVRIPLISLRFSSVKTNITLKDERSYIHITIKCYKW